jgi:HipA-like protein
MPLSVLGYQNEQTNSENKCHGEEANSESSNILIESSEIYIQRPSAENQRTTVEPSPPHVAILTIPRPPPTGIVALHPHKAAVIAVQHIRRMRGGAQSHLMRCSDGNCYVVKFSNNPQHLRVLANDMFATRLAEATGLPVPDTEVIEVGEWLVSHTPELNIQLPDSITIPCSAGLQFGSRYVVNPLEGQVWDDIPLVMLARVRNLPTFVGMLAMDKWTGNSDGRQAAFWRKMRQRRYAVTFIDQGNCFNAGDWDFPDNPLWGTYRRIEVYDRVRGWDSFEPWLSRIETMEGYGRQGPGSSRCPVPP